MLCSSGCVTVIHHQKNPYRRGETLTAFLPSMEDAARQIVNSVSLTLGDIIEGCPHLLLQADRRSVSGDNKIAADQVGTCSRQGFVVRSTVFSHFLSRPGRFLPSPAFLISNHDFVFQD